MLLDEGWVGIVVSEFEGPTWAKKTSYSAFLLVNEQHNGFAERIGTIN
jgi:hypothetical protein